MPGIFDQTINYVVSGRLNTAASGANRRAVNLILAVSGAQTIVSSENITEVFFMRRI